MDSDGIDQEHQDNYLPTPSAYMGGKYSPNTPGILSRDTSPTRKERRRKRQQQVRYSHESFFPSEVPSSMSKAKSTSALVASDRSGPHRRGDDLLNADNAFLHKSKSIAPAPQGSGDEWMYRAGLAITSESRLTKGQSWIATRASSTALNMMTADDDYAGKRQERLALLSNDPSQQIDLDDVPSYYHQYTPKNLSRNGSRAASRAASRPGSKSNSRAPSRRGSRVGSRNDIIGLTPMPNEIGFERPPGSVSSAKLSASRARDVPGYFDAVDTVVGAEPDFVGNEQDEEYERKAGSKSAAQLGKDEDNEVAHLARTQRGFGISSIVDKFVGFTLFNVDEDGNESENTLSNNIEKDLAEDSKGSVAERKQAESRRRKEMLERTASSSAISTSKSAQAHSIPPTPPAPESDGEKASGWKDAAWLLSVASRVLY